MEPMTLDLLKALDQATYAVRREGGRVVFAPAPPPEHRPVLAHWKDALPHALEEGERIPAQGLLRLERLGAVLAAWVGVPKLTWCTFYYSERPEPERVLAPGENLLAHLRWRARNLPAPYRVHLGSTDAALTLDLQEPVQSFLKVEDRGRVEVYGWPEWRMREYLWAAKEGRARGPRATLEWKGEVHQGTWPELAQVVGPVEKVRVFV